MKGVQTEVDDLLRVERFIDLHAVTKMTCPQSVRK